MSGKFSDNEKIAIPCALSVPRFGTYLTEAGQDLSKALELYQWNAQIAASFLVPLHLFEICIRNSVANAIESFYGANWPWAAAFAMSLPDPHQPNFNPRRELVAVRARHFGTMATGKVIADVKFAFWVSMYTRRHEGRLWAQNIKQEFPHAPETLTVAEIRQKIHTATDQIRILRNRIAHHEPIFPRDLSSDYKMIEEVIGFKCQHTLAWMIRLEEVSYMLSTKP